MSPLVKTGRRMEQSGHSKSTGDYDTWDSIAYVTTTRLLAICTHVQVSRARSIDLRSSCAFAAIKCWLYCGAAQVGSVCVCHVWLCLLCNCF